MKVINHCLQCNTEIHTTKAKIAAGRGKFCSRACAARFHHTGRPKPKSRANIKKANVVRQQLGNPAWNKGELVSFICQICGAPFEVWPSRAKNHPPKYCSRECAHEAKRRVTGPDHPLWTRVQCQCEWCKRTVWVKPAKLDEFRFCSRSCLGAYTSKQMAELNGPTSIERLLMDELERRHISYEPQYQIDRWVVDIALPKHYLAIEADGDYWHSSTKQKGTDRYKTRWLESHGWSVYRFSGSEIRSSATACIDKVIASFGNNG